MNNGDPDGQTSIRRNRIQNNRRPGLYIRSANNRIEDDVVTGNGLSTLPPQLPRRHGRSVSGGSNEWMNNSGTFERIPPFSNPACR